MKGFVLLKKDIRTVLRNRRELMWMIMVPLILLAANFFLQDQKLEVKVALVGDEQLLPSLEHRVAEAAAGQIQLVIWSLSEAEAARRLEAGQVHAYLVLTEPLITMHANVSETEGAVAQAIFTEVVRDSNQRLATATISDLGEDPGAILQPIDWQVIEVSKPINSMGQVVYSSLFVIMGVMTALSLGQQSINMERYKNTLVSLRKSPLSDHQIVWAKLGAGLFSALLPIAAIIALATTILPAEFATDPGFYLILLSICFNSVALGVLIGAYTRGSNEGNGIRFLLALPAMFLAAVPVVLPFWLDRISGIVPTLISAQIVRDYFAGAYRPTLGPIGFLWLTGIASVQIAANYLGREE